MGKKIDVRMTEEVLDEHTSKTNEEEEGSVCAIEGCSAKGGNPMVGLGSSPQHEQDAVDHDDNYDILPILLCDRHYNELMSRYYKRRVLEASS
jgi:hypothetical protein